MKMKLSETEDGGWRSNGKSGSGGRLDAGRCFSLSSHLRGEFVHDDPAELTFSHFIDHGISLTK